MALIECPYCGNRISNLAPLCIYCGCNIGDADENTMYEIKNNTLIKYHGNREVISIPGGVTAIARGALP